jgi:FKBP-type peptidyl-prolyl cis-trans isomerase
MMQQNLEALSYCVGMSIAGSLKQQGLQNINPDILSAAITDVLHGNKLRYSPDQANQIIERHIQEEEMRKFGQNKALGEAFLSENKNRAGVVTTDSGLQYEVIVDGTGVKPTAQSSVTVHYHGTLIDGTVFDSSKNRGTPATFGVNQVISGWTEALQLMTVGSSYRLYIPQELAYGAHPHPGGAIQPYSALIFDVELLAVSE